MRTSKTYPIRIDPLEVGNRPVEATRRKEALLLRGMPNATSAGCVQVQGLTRCQG